MKERRINIRLIKRGVKLIRKISPFFVELTIVQAMLTAITPYIPIYMSAEILTEIANECRVERLFFLVIITIFSVLVVAILSAILSNKINVLKYRFNTKYDELLTDKAYSLDYEQIEKSSVGELRAAIDTNRITFGGGLSSVVRGISNITTNILSIFVAAFLSIGMFLNENSSNLSLEYVNKVVFICGLLIIVLIILAIFITSVFQRTMLKKNFEMFKSMSKFNQMSNYYNYSYLDENKAAKEIRIFNQEKFLSHLYYNDLLIPMWKSTKMSLKLSEKYQFIHAFFMALIGGLVYIYVALKTYLGHFETGKIIQYYSALMKFIISFSGLVNDIYMFLDNNQYLELLFEYLDLPNENDNKGKTINNTEFVEIAFNNVSFKYSNAQTYALKNVSFKIHNGEHIAIVGTNGSGKSTIIKLLCRFYKPTSGYITLNGININEYDSFEYRKFIATVFQDYKLLSLSIGQNVSCEIKPNVSKVLKTLDDVGLKKGVLNLENSLETNIYTDFDENGIEFSGGEEQKIAIARALYKEASVIILDEPTASLDPYSEEKIYNDFMKVITGKTAIFVTHRLSSCKAADIILVIDNGRVIQEGSHSSLIKLENEKYAELWFAQSDLYNQKLDY